MGIKRVTKNTRHFIEYFDQKDTAVSVVDLVKQFDHLMNRATVYRLLSRLEKEGIVHSFIGKDGIKWFAKCYGCNYETHTDIHPHFHCNDCGEVKCMSEPIQNPLLDGYHVESVNVLVVGKCQNCN